MANCPICDEPPFSCTCRFGAETCGRCGQPVGSARSVRDLLTRITEGRFSKPRRRVGTEKFLRRLSEGGGSIVSTASLTHEQIAEARSDDRLLVLADGLGFVYVEATP